MKATERNIKILQNRVKALQVKLERQEKTFTAYGNKHGCFFEIDIVESNEHDQVIEIKNGDCCVFTLQAQIPVTLFTQFLTYIHDNREKIMETIPTFGNEDYNDFIKNKTIWKGYPPIS